MLGALRRVGARLATGRAGHPLARRGLSSSATAGPSARGLPPWLRAWAPAAAGAVCASAAAAATLAAPPRVAHAQGRELEGKADMFGGVLIDITVPCTRRPRAHAETRCE